MSKTILLVLFMILFAPVTTRAQRKSDRELSDLSGLVQTVKDEEADIEFENGRRVEGKRRLSSIETYTIDGAKSLYAVYTEDRLSREWDSSKRARKLSYTSERKASVPPDTGNLSF